MDWDRITRALASCGVSELFREKETPDRLASESGYRAMEAERQVKELEDKLAKKRAALTYWHLKAEKLEEELAGYRRNGGHCVCQEVWRERATAAECRVEQLERVINKHYPAIARKATQILEAGGAVAPELLEMARDFNQALNRHGEEKK